MEISQRRDGAGHGGAGTKNGETENGTPEHGETKPGPVMEMGLQPEEAMTDYEPDDEMEEVN